MNTLSDFDTALDVDVDVNEFGMAVMSIGQGRRKGSLRSAEGTLIEIRHERIAYFDLI